MNGAFEEDDSLHSPIEAFIFDSKTMSFPIKAHWHYFAELIYVLEGCALIRADNTTQTVRQGEFILFQIRYKPSHSYSCICAKAARYIQICRTNRQKDIFR